MTGRYTAAGTRRHHSFTDGIDCTQQNVLVMRRHGNATRNAELTRLKTPDAQTVALVVRGIFPGIPQERNKEGRPIWPPFLTTEKR